MADFFLHVIDLPSNLTYSHKCVCTIHKQFLLLMYKLYTIFVVVHVIFITLCFKFFVFSLEIAAIVCGVPVMISDCEQDIDMREKEPTSVVETNLVKNSGNMELDMSLNTKETSDCEIHNKMNQLKDTDLHDVYFEKNFDDMELEDSVSNKIIKTPTVETVHELKEDVVAHEALEKNKINVETLTSNNEKTTESVNFDIVTAVQERKHADLCAEHSGRDSAKMEIENYASEKPVTTSFAGQTLIDVEIVNEMKGSVTVQEALDKNKVNIETLISNNEKATESHKLDILNEVQERKEAVLCVDHSDKNMEIESYTSEKPVATPSACQTSVDIEKQKQPNLYSKEEEYENSTLDISISDKEMICVPGKIIIFFVLMFVINSLITSGFKPM